MALVALPRPTLAAAWQKFNYIYSGGDLVATGDKIGGKVKYNIDLGKESPQLGFTNGCAIRLSYVLNHTGMQIPFIDGQVSSGADGKWYIFRVRELIRFLHSRMGSPDFAQRHPAPAHFKGRKGILVFEVAQWADAEGHATLWNGMTCSDNCYFPKAEAAHLWSLQ